MHGVFLALCFDMYLKITHEIQELCQSLISFVSRHQKFNMLNFLCHDKVFPPIILLVFF